MENHILNDLYELAMRAHSGTSFSPEKRGQAILNDYGQELTEDLLLITDEESKARYLEGYKSKLSSYLSAKGRCLSTMITGPANFPVARNEKANRSADNRYSEFRQWREYFHKSIAKAAERAKPQAQKDAEEFERIKTGILSTCATIIGIDNGTVRGSSRPLFVSNLANRLTTIANNGKGDLIVKCLDLIKEVNATIKKPIFSDNHSVWKLAEQAQTAQEKAFDKGNAEREVLSFESGEVVLNHAIDRIQILYKSKPDPETISRLKKNAFKWSPTQTAWQRQLTLNAKYATSNLTGVKF